MENGTHMGYLANDLARDIEIPTSTLSKWTSEFEKKSGILIKRNEKEQHIYSDRELKAFREIKNLLNNRVPFEDAITDAATMYLENESNHKDEVRLSKSELQEIIRKEVQSAIEEEREAMFKAIEVKMNEMKEWLKEVIR
ncbi:MerR family transcriptional regulator [Paenibacillus solisilvae]|uniref:MerR family transcriptional regulator n=1 Tax=Paenibacillus solisilvae TaxID=2486751 RepID=A0ABW0VYW7_9BACL